MGRRVSRCGRDTRDDLVGHTGGNECGDFLRSAPEQVWITALQAADALASSYPLDQL